LKLLFEILVKDLGISVAFQAGEEGIGCGEAGLGRGGFFYPGKGRQWGNYWVEDLSIS
jgi:hypothetical protein